MPDLAALLAANLTKYGGDIGVKDLTLIKIAPGVRTPGEENKGTNPTSTPYPASGWIELFTDRQINGTLIRAGDRKLSILGATLPDGIVPAPNDKVTIVDIDGVQRTLRIEGQIGADGVGAVFTLIARP